MRRRVRSEKARNMSSVVDHGRGSSGLGLSAAALPGRGRRIALSRCRVVAGRRWRCRQVLGERTAAPACAHDGGVGAQGAHEAALGFGNVQQKTGPAPTSSDLG